MCFADGKSPSASWRRRRKVGRRVGDDCHGGIRRALIVHDRLPIATARHHEVAAADSIKRDALDGALVMRKDGRAALVRNVPERYCLIA